MPFKRRYDLGEDSNRVNVNERLIYVGRVIDIDDEFDAMRIKARIKGIDDKFSDEELPICPPFLPKFLTTLPKVGETVKIILHNQTNPFKNREYIGPVISQPQKLNYDPHFFSSRSGTDDSIIQLDKSPSTLEDLNGVYPRKDHISLQGRLNTDIILKPTEVLMRSGKFTLKDGTLPKDRDGNIPLSSLQFNDKNPGIISMKYTNNLNLEPSTTTKNVNGNLEVVKLNSSQISSSITNIVSDKINLITHNNGTISKSAIELSKDLSNDDEVKYLRNLLDTTELHPVVFGDVLIKFLKLIQVYIANHAHSAPGHPVGSPTKDTFSIENAETSKLSEILNFPLDSLISKDIKVN